jgi:hypothetical protein
LAVLKNLQVNEAAQNTAKPQQQARSQPAEPGLCSVVRVGGSQLSPLDKLGGPSWRGSRRCSKTITPRSAAD